MIVDEFLLDNLGHASEWIVRPGMVTIHPLQQVELWLSTIYWCVLYHRWCDILYRQWVSKRGKCWLIEYLNHSKQCFYNSKSNLLLLYIPFFWVSIRSLACLDNIICIYNNQYQQPRGRRQKSSSFEWCIQQSRRPPQLTTTFLTSPTRYDIGSTHPFSYKDLLFLML